MQAVLQNPVVSDALLLVGGLGLLTSLSGNWFFVFPIAEISGVPVVPRPGTSYDPNYVVGGWAENPGTVLKAWAFWVFNLSQSEAGLMNDSAWTWYHEAGDGWESWRWGQVDPTIPGSKPETGYGTLGPYWGWLSLAAVVGGLVLKKI